MTKADQDYLQPLGLDVGTSRIVVARCADKKYRYESQLNAFLTLPYSKLAESLLLRENVFHEVRGTEIVVAGNDAERFAEVFHVETRRPMANGVLNPQEPHSLAVVRSIITKLVGSGQRREAENLLQRAGSGRGKRRRNSLPPGLHQPDSQRTGLRSHAHHRRAGGGLRRVGRL